MNTRLLEHRIRGGKMKGSDLTEDRERARRDGQGREAGDLNSKQGNPSRRARKKRAQVSMTSRHWWKRPFFFFYI